MTRPNYDRDISPDWLINQPGVWLPSPWFNNSLGEGRDAIWFMMYYVSPTFLAKIKGCQTVIAGSNSRPPDKSMYFFLISQQKHI